MSRPSDSKTVFTLVFVFGLLALTVLRVNGWRVPSSSWSNWKVFQFQQASTSPQEAIYTMIDAERAGNTKAYLDAFTGSMRDELLQVVKENSEAKFASYLSQNATFQGVAVTITDQPSPVEAQARVDYVYGDRNEIQNLYLRREGKQWKILKVAGAEQLKSPFPFGSGVTD
jgi:hypothetical protein